AAAVAFTQRGGEANHILLTDVAAAPLPDGDLGVFLKVENRGAPDRLIGVSSPEASAELYSPEAASGPPLPAGQGPALAADGAHVRLSGLSGAVEDGRLVPLTLTFETAGEVTTKARVSKPQGEGAASEVGLFGLGDICVVGEGEPAPAVALKVLPDGEGWRIVVETDEFEFSDALTGLYHVPGMGHGHIYVGGMKIGRLYQPEARIGALPKGEHLVRLTLNTNDHRAYVVDDEPVTATAMIVVE
ncbi:MAG: copper chaperone PCu(A)C, partial [Pseudomonadota bacterium]